MCDEENIDPLAPFKEAPEEIQRIMKRILAFEKERLFQVRVHGYETEISNIVKEEIQ
jgi:hypothetical protein